MEYEGSGCLGRIFWYLLVVPVLWIIGKISGDGPAGPD